MTLTEHLTISGNFDYYSCDLAGRKQVPQIYHWHFAGRDYRIVVNLLRCTGLSTPLPQTKDYPVQNANNADAEKPCTGNL